MINLWSDFKCQIDLLMDYVENLKHQELNVKVQTIITNTLRVLLYVENFHKLLFKDHIITLHTKDVEILYLFVVAICNILVLHDKS